MSLFEAIKNREEKISVIGLGYVGLPLAIAFDRVADVVGLDRSQRKIRQYIAGVDVTKEVGNEAVQKAGVKFTTDFDEIKTCKFHVVAVPTPINEDKTPDLSPVISAAATVGKNLVKGSVVVFESTVFPGVTEEICVPILEKESGLKCGVDFKVGYSPERINPGDPIHRLENIVKVVAGMDEASLEDIAKVYEMIIEAGVYRAESIKVAEAAKVIENSQRDINIAFMNELSVIFNKMDIDTKAVLLAANTKWNFLNFSPGLVGGHCIGVDPYYLTYKAEQLGYHSQIILAGRKINDDMGRYVVENFIKKLIKADIPVKGAKVAILGLTFKENCQDTRNTKVLDIIKELREYDIHPVIADPQADGKQAQEEYGIDLVPLGEISGMDGVIVAVGHKDFLDLKPGDLQRMYKEGPEKNRVLIDVKGIYKREDYQDIGYHYWRL
jgi:UDP-N-acetyl-D-glucosamine/UDP-N-acetyl-D-galactosamine dehydrogenase